MKVFAILDDRMNRFMHPFFALTVGAALRMFQDACNDTSTLFHKHPADFRIYHLADWSDESGRFENQERPQLLGTASDFIDPAFKKQLQLMPTGKETA